MIRIPALITNEYPELAVLYEHDVKFSDILPDVRFNFGRTLAVMGDMVWQRFASELGLTAEDIMYATTLTAHNGSAVLNMFDTYMARYKNSLLDVVHALSKLENKRALTKIKELWPAIRDSQQRVTQRVASPDQHQMTLSSIDSGHNGEHVVMEDGVGETLVRSCDSSMITHIPCTAASQTPAKQYQHPVAMNQCLHPRQPCQSPAYHQSLNTTYDWTRAWVESNGFLKNNNGSIPFVKEEKPSVSLNCSVSNDTARIELQSVRNSVAEFSNKQQVEANNVKSFCSTVPQDPVTANRFVKAGDSSSMSRGKLLSFSTSCHKGSSQIEDGSFNPLALVPNGDCSVILNNNTHLLENGEAARDVEQMDMSFLDRSTSSPYHTLPLSKSQKKKLDSVIHRKSGSLHPVGPALDALRRSPSCTGKVESCPYADSMRNSSIFITHLYRGLSPTQTKSESFNNKCAISLGTCLKDNRFRIQMDVPKRNRVPGDEDWRNWLDRKFSTANFIIVCVTPEYLEVVNSLEIEDHDELMDNIQSTRYIYHLMQHEFEENYGVNSRFIPVLFKDLQNYPVGFLPNFLQTEGMGPYVWSRDYLDLLWRLDRHEVRLSNINGMT